DLGSEREREQTFPAPVEVLLVELGIDVVSEEDEERSSVRDETLELRERCGRDLRDVREDHDRVSVELDVGREIRPDGLDRERRESRADRLEPIIAGVERE